MRHKKGFVIGLFLILVMFLNMMSSCSVLAQAILSGGTGGTFPCEDADMLGAEADYAALEAALQNEVDNYPNYHPGYDEYRYDLVLHPVRNRIRTWSGIFAGQGRGRRRADARQGR